jgi:hypothetical protein
VTALVARRLEGASARIVGRRPLRYEGGADRATGRPEFVRAGSGLAWQVRDEQDVLVIAQDDSSFLAFLRPPDGPVGAIVLAYAPGGVRVFEARKGTKKLKLDLESCAAIDKRRALVFGSGSLPVRERIVDLTGELVRLVDAKALYAALRAERAFAGSELNVEGACRVGDRLLLANRGNGAARPDQPAVDGLCEVSLPALLAYLDGRGPCPALENVRSCDLGTLGGGRLTFTDLTPEERAEKKGAGRVFFLAAAELSPNAQDDGEVTGAAIGSLDLASNALALIPIEDETGAPSRDKVEGLAIAPKRGGMSRFYAIVDADDPDVPSALLTIEVRGL